MLRGFVVEVTVIFYCRTLRRQEGGEALVRVAHWMADKTELQGGLSRDANRPRSEVELMLLKNVLIDGFRGSRIVNSGKATNDDAGRFSDKV
ncbi:hypothetical protein BofuT4_uP049560.1 [Botrytis cinerea T4]|uniref:Uncharacterized protein n=1 Tax=Botryotinia fuckeliana (strain T4) TaxID=999810 RepID=G2XZQ1_BOTF4|nr:hypothetical protein BofuT4_uP049560.1 [Botrytis cinerea T4]